MRALEPGASGRTVIRSEEVNRVEFGCVQIWMRWSERIGRSVRGLSSRRRVNGGAADWRASRRRDGCVHLGARCWVCRHLRLCVRALCRPTAIARHEVRIVLQPKGERNDWSPIVVDTPLSQQDVAQPFALKGWAADLDAAVGTGISTLHVWAYPLAGGPPLFLGSAVYGSARPDVVVAHGGQFADSGFSLFVQGLPHGNYDLAVFAWSEAVGGFLPARTVRATVR